MALLSHKTEPVGNAGLEKWESAGQGGFGYVYKARHKDLGFDVAIKILRDKNGPLKLLWTEAKYMEMASCEYVLRVYGTYQGCPPGWESMEQGLVMEFMERGSVESLQKLRTSEPPDLSGPLLWPLVCRMAHQVALGMNFIHLKGLVHRDLKPSNVLLNVDLNAKLADFGLARVSNTALNGNRDTISGIEGSYKYMPPEAFKVPYDPIRSFDIYSYGILLWSIITGTEPYPCAGFDVVEQSIPSGNRPTCEKIDQMREEGLKELVELMKRCWDNSPVKRPPFKECLEVTEKVFSKHQNGIHEAVGQVLTKLKSPAGDRSNTTMASNVPHQPPEQSNDTVDNVISTTSERSPIRESVRISTMSSAAKAKFVDEKRAKLIQNVTMVMAITDELGDMVHPEAYGLINKAGTSMDQMRTLYRLALHSGGEEVKAAFYDALNEHQPRVLEKLGGLL